MGATMKPPGHHDDNPNAVYFNHIHAAAVVPHLLRGFRTVQCAPMTSSAQVASQLHLSNCFLLISPPFFPIYCISPDEADFSAGYTTNLSMTTMLGGCLSH
jgi:hypothetical protein